MPPFIYTIYIDFILSVAIAVNDNAIACGFRLDNNLDIAIASCRGKRIDPYLIVLINKPGKHWFVSSTNTTGDIVIPSHAKAFSVWKRSNVFASISNSDKPTFGKISYR